MRSNYERVRLCYALSVRKNTGRKAQKVRKFPDGSALPLALKSVQNHCKIFNGFYLKFRPKIRTPGGIEKIWFQNFEK